MGITTRLQCKIPDFSTGFPISQPILCKRVNNTQRLISLTLSKFGVLSTIHMPYYY